MQDNFLHQYFLNNNGKIIHKWIHYFDIYEKHFRSYVDKPIVMFEIGFFQGGSTGNISLLNNLIIGD